MLFTTVSHIWGVQQKLELNLKYNMFYHREDRFEISQPISGTGNIYLITCKFISLKLKIQCDSVTWPYMNTT